MASDHDWKKPLRKLGRLEAEGILHDAPYPPFRGQLEHQRQDVEAEENEPLPFEDES